jgi:Spy/CpxP family protein refolding chaperone
MRRLITVALAATVLAAAVGAAAPASAQPGYWHRHHHWRHWGPGPGWRRHCGWRHGYRVCHRW